MASQITVVIAGFSRFQPSFSHFLRRKFPAGSFILMGRGNPHGRLFCQNWHKIASCNSTWSSCLVYQKTCQKVLPPPSSSPLLLSTWIATSQLVRDQKFPIIIFICPNLVHTLNTFNPIYGKNTCTTFHMYLKVDFIFFLFQFLVIFQLSQTIQFLKSFSKNYMTKC